MRKVQNQNIKEDNLKLHQIWNDEQAVYNEYAHFHHLSGSMLFVLYTLFHAQDRRYTQRELADELHLPIQTINSIVKKFVKEGYIELKHLVGSKNSKAIYVTKAGERFIDQVVPPLMEAQLKALALMTKEERTTLIALSKKQNRLLQKVLKKLY